MRLNNLFVVLSVIAAASLFGAMVIPSIFGAETISVSQYINELKFQVCPTQFDIYNLTEYYRCIGQ